MESENKKDPIRSMTSLSLDWLARRLRKARNIKERLENGKYMVDNVQVAKSILDEDLEQ